MDATTEKLRMILIKALDFQYSSAASMYILDGQHPPKKFGSNCYEQARNLRNALIAAGFDQTYFIEESLVGRHRSLISLINGERFYFNPYFMHCELIDLDATRPKNKFNSYPIVNGNYSPINITMDGNQLTVVKQWPLQKRVDKFIFDINKPIANEWHYEDYFSRVFHPEQTTLSIRFLNTTSGTVDHLAYAIDDTIKNNRQLFIKTNENKKILESDSVLFDKKLEELTTLISSNKKETLDFLYGAIDLHKKLQEKKPTFPRGPMPFPYK